MRFPPSKQRKYKTSLLFSSHDNQISYTAIRGRNSVIFPFPAHSPSDILSGSVIYKSISISSRSPFIMCYAMSCDFASLIFALARVNKAL